MLAFSGLEFCFSARKCGGNALVFPLSPPPVHGKLRDSIWISARCIQTGLLSVTLSATYRARQAFALTEKLLA